MKILEKTLYFIHLLAYGVVLTSFGSIIVGLYIKFSIKPPQDWVINILFFSLMLIINVILRKTYKWIAE